MTQPAPGNPVHYAILLFPGFQLLDIAGPIDVFTVLSWSQSPLKLSFISNEASSLVQNVVAGLSPGDNSTNFSTSVASHYSLSDAPSDIDVLVVPGGMGTRALEATQPHVDFIRSRYPQLKYVISVCTGSGLLARSGILDGRQATTNKRAWDWVISQGPNTEWIRKARWVVADNVWTTSGISAGIDGALGFVEHLYGADIANETATRLEYSRVQTSTDDPFA